MVSRDFLTSYQVLVREKNYTDLISYFIKQFYSIGIKLGYLNGSAGDKFLNRVKNLRVIIDCSLPGDAKIDGNCLRINPNLTFCRFDSVYENEKYASEVIFHEFTHLINCFHDDLNDTNGGLLRIFTENFHTLMRSKFGILINKNNSENPDNLDLYAKNGIYLLDEAVAQYVAEDMLDYKYGRKRKVTRQYFAPADIYYMTSFNEYGLFQGISEKFSRTLAGVNNLREFSKLALQDGLIEKILSEHTENSTAFYNLYRELSYFGILLFSLYHNYGHAGGEMPSLKVLNNSYRELNKLLSYGEEKRDYITTPALVVDKYRKTINW